MNLQKQQDTSFIFLRQSIFSLCLLALFLVLPNLAQAEFIDNNNGTIFDSETGLTWQKSDDGIPRSWREALELSENLTLAGCTTWRLPNRKELRSLVDRSRTNPAIDPIFDSQSDQYWTSSPTRWFKRVWSVDFSKGRVRLSDPLGDFHYIRAVSGGCELDATPPLVSTINPAADATAVSVSSNITVSFNEEIAPATLTLTTFLVKEDDLNAITGTISYSNGNAAFTPTVALQPGTNYSVTLTTAVTDIAGNGLTTEYQWFFTTEVELDTEPPIGSININSGALSANTTAVNLILSATDNSGTVALMQFRNDGGSWSADEPYLPIKTYELSPGEGTKTVEVQFKDASGNTSGPYSDTIELDTTPPAISINQVVSPTGADNQILSGQTGSGSTITVTSNTWAHISGMQVNDSNWQCTISGLATGANTVTAVATDGAGNTSSATTTIDYDNLAPSGSITLHNGASQTNSTAVTLNLAATDNYNGDIFFRLANSGTNWTDWQTMTTGLSWLLLPGDGEKTVYIQYQDSAGNITGIQAASIALDTVAPNVSVDQEFMETSQSSQTISGTMEEGVILDLTVDSSAVAGQINLTSTTWQTTITGLAPGVNPVTVRATDLAGNAAQASSTILHDNESPTGSVSINHGASATALLDVVLAFSAEDSGGQIADLRVKNSSDAFWLDWQPFTSSLSWTLSSGDGVKTVEAEFRDASGNVSALLSDSIVLDTTSPLLTINPTSSLVTSPEIIITGTRESNTTVSVVAPGAWSGPVDHSDPTGWTCSLVLTEGNNPITATATDGAGNSSSASISITLDSLAEFTVNPPLSPTSQDNQVLTGTMESGSTVTVSVVAPATADAVNQTSENTWTCQISGLEPGNNVITLNSTDSWGNSGSLTTSIYVDNTGPSGSVSINNGADLASSLNVALYLSVTDDSNGATMVSIRDNGSTWSDWQFFSPILMWTVPAGDVSKTVEVQFKDASGNTSPVYGDSIVIDTVNPTVSIDPVNTPTAFASQILQGSREAGAIVTLYSPGGLVSQVSYPTETTWQSEVALNSGLNYISATAKDTAGNQASDTVAIMLDNTTTVSINATNNPTNSSQITLTGNMESDAVVSVSAPTATVFEVEYPSASFWQVTLSDMAMGSNIVTVSAIDNLDNSMQASVNIFVDTSLPSGAIIINGDAPVTNSSTVTLNLSATDNDTAVSQMRFRNSSSSWGVWIPYASSSSWTLTAAEGNQSVEAEFMDEAGNISPSASDSITLDRTAPAVTIDPVTSPTDMFSQTISGTRESGALITVVAPAVTVESVSYPDNTTWQFDLPLNEGVNNITVLANDGAANTGSVATSITLDTIGIVSLNPITNPTNQTTLLLTGNKEPYATVTVDVSLTATVGTVSYPSSTSWSCLISDLQEGDNLITVATEDVLTNTGNSAITLTVDLTPPDVTLSPVTSLVTTAAQSLSGTIEDGAFLSVTAPSAIAITPLASGTSWNSDLTLAEGSNTITITARDAAGNENSISQIITLDSIAEVSINDLTYVNTAVQTLTGTMESGSTIIQVNADTGAAIGVVTSNATSWQCPITLVEGPNTLTVQAQDGLTNSGQATTVIILDTAIPTLSTDATPALISQTSQTITGSRSADSLISINSATAVVQGISYPTATTWQASLILNEGDNTIQIIATDPAGNSNTTSIQIAVDSMVNLTFNYLQSPTNISSQPLSGTQESAATVTLEAEPAAVSQSTVTDTTWQGSISLIEGENTITVTAEDLLGNRKIIHRTVRLDTQAPQVTIDPVATQLNVSTILLTGSRDSDSIVTVRNDNTTQGPSVHEANLPTSYSWEQLVTLPDGDNTITVRAIDQAGNSSTMVINIAVDTIAVVTLNPIASPTKEPTHLLSGSKEIGSTVEVSINGSSAGLTVGYNTPDSWQCAATLIDGDNLVTVTATDLSSNQNSINANIILDTTPPAQVDITATDTLLGGSVSLDWTPYPTETEEVSTFLVYLSQSDFNDIGNLVPIRELSPGSTDFTVQGMQNGETWYFAVVAVDAAGNANPQVTTASAVASTQGIDGYVTDNSTGLPLRDAKVTVSGQNLAYTNNDGYYHLAGLSVGSYDLTVTGAGYIQATQPGTAVQTASMTRVSVGLEPEIILPSVPENISAVAGDSQLTINWDDIPDTDFAGYLLYRFTSPADTNPVQVNTELITGAFYVDMDLINNQTYYYTVRSVDQAGYTSDDSFMVSATPVAGPPLPATDLAVLLNTDNTATLTWHQSPTPGVELYHVYQDDGSGSIDYLTPIASVPAGTTTWTSPVLAADSTSYFGLRTEKNTLVEENTNLVVSVTVPEISTTGPRTVIVAPTSGKTVSGNMLTVEAALVQGDPTQVQHVTFQYRARGASNWNNIAPASAYSLNPDADSPYFIHWDVVTDVPVGEYELRSVTTATDNSVDPSPESVVITIDHADAQINENSNRKARHKLQRDVRRWLRNEIKFHSTHASASYTVTVPAQALESDTELTVEIPKDEELADKLQGVNNINRFLRLTLSSGQKQFNAGREVEITIPYPDADDDGIVDGTSFAADQLQILWYNPQISQWVNSGLIDVTVDQLAKTVSVKTGHFSVFAVIGTDTSGGIGSSVSLVNFGQQAIATTSTPVTLTVTQDGAADVTIGNSFLSGLHAGDININQDTCSGTILAQSATCIFELTFTPARSGTRTASLLIPSDDPTTPNLTISLSGEGIEVDSDGDGMPDSWEIANGLNPLVDDASLNPDGDALTNLQEYLNGSDPYQQDATGQSIHHVPVFNGIWALFGVLAGLIIARRKSHTG